MISLNQLSKTYYHQEKPIPVLQGLNLEVRPGEICAIVGESGSGKSTLLSILAALLKPDEGKLVVGSHDLMDLSSKGECLYRGEELGIIFQQFMLVPTLTALQNVEICLDVSLHRRLPAAKRREMAVQALEKVGLGMRTDHFPSELSGGEKQRVAIARAIVKEPKVLLADEPTGSLDEKTSAQIEDLLFSVLAQSDTTSLIVTHSKPLAERCQRRFLLQEGKLCEY